MDGGSPDYQSREDGHGPCKRFASVSPDLSGHGCQTHRAPMLVGTPGPVNLSVFVALGPALWIGRLLPPIRTATYLLLLVHPTPSAAPARSPRRSGIRAPGTPAWRTR